MIEVATLEATQDLSEEVDKEAESGQLTAKRNHPEEGIIGELEEGIRTRNTSKVDYRDLAGYVCFNSTIEPKNVKEALQDEFWVAAMQEELSQFERNEV